MGPRIGFRLLGT